jgi:hypothetical protein
VARLMWAFHLELSDLRVTQPRDGLDRNAQVAPG